MLKWIYRSSSKCFIIRDCQHEERCQSWVFSKNNLFCFCISGKESDLPVSSSQKIWGMRGAFFLMVVLSSSVSENWFQTVSTGILLLNKTNKLCQSYYGLIAVVGRDSVVFRIAYFHQYLNPTVQGLNCVFQMDLIFPARYCFYLGCFQKL